MPTLNQIWQKFLSSSFSKKLKRAFLLFCISALITLKLLQKKKQYTDLSFFIKEIQLKNVAEVILQDNLAIFRQFGSSEWLRTNIEYLSLDKIYKLLLEKPEIRVRSVNYGIKDKLGLFMSIFLLKP